MTTVDNGDRRMEAEMGTTPNTLRGPMETQLRRYIVEGERTLVDPREHLAKAREFDAAFAALESALRDLAESVEDDPDIRIVDFEYPLQAAKAALALAEGCRSSLGVVK